MGRDTGFGGAGDGVFDIGRVGEYELNTRSGWVILFTGRGTSPAYLFFAWGAGANETSRHVARAAPSW